MDEAPLPAAGVARPEPGPAPRAARVLDAVLVIGAAAVVVGRLLGWAETGLPELQPFTLTALATSMVLVAVVSAGDDRTVSRLVGPTVLAVSLAVIASPVVRDSPREVVRDSPREVVPVWALLALLTYAVMRRVQLWSELPLACAQIIAGEALVLAVQVPGLGVPNERIVVGMLAFAAVVVPLTWLRERLYGRPLLPGARSATGLRLALAGAAYAVGTVAALNWLYADPQNRWAAVVLVVPAVFVAVVTWQAGVVSALRRTSEALLSAVRATPWPEERTDALMVQLVRDHVRADDVAVSPAAGARGTVSEQVTGDRWLVARRRPGDRRFSRRDADIVAGVAALGRTSYERAEREGRLRAEAMTDALTGLWEYQYWRYLLEAQSRLRADGENIGVVFFDLDHFKAVNETVGHLRANIVLETLGRRLTGLSRQWRFGRFGGDEFVGFRREVRDEDHLDELCDELRRVVAEPVGAYGRDIVPSITVGRTLSTDADENPARIVVRAERDARGRKAARPGGGEPTDQDLVQALLDDGLRVAFQPVRSLRDDTLAGYEALLRSEIPGLGQVPALTLISAAGQVGALDTVTLRVAEVALDVVGRACERLGRRLVAGINLESDQLHWDNVALEWLADAAPGFPGTILVEISERGDAPWEAEQYEVLGHLESHGVAVALDDYGAGQSRLRALARRRWHTVKMDRDFLTTDEPGLVLLRHNVQAMHELGQAMVLEGLETQQHVDLARSLGIDYGQGHFLGRPVSADELLAGLG